MKVTNRTSYSIFFLSLFSILAYYTESCSKDPIREKKDDPTDTFPVSQTYTNGIFIINEGNFNWGNASVSYINQETGKVEQNIFEEANQRGLGDVAQSMQIFRNYGLILINNSNKVEVVNLKDFKSVKSITGFTAPRYLEVIDSNKAYVTNLKKDISVINLHTLTVEKTIKTPTWTEGLVKFDHFVFITSVGDYYLSNAFRKAQIYIIDTDKDMIIDSILTGKEPMGIVIDKKQKIWVMCTGGYDHFEDPSLIRIDPALRIVEKTYIFPATGSVPSRLCINSAGDILYYLKGGVYQMPVTSSELPSEPLINPDGHLFYGLAIHPKTGCLYVSDAVDYVQTGFVFQFNSQTGQQINSYTAGRIPGSFCFTSNSGKK